MRDADDDEFEVDDAPGLLPCPHCVGTIAEETEFCPHCGKSLLESGGADHPPWWVLLGVIVCLAVVAHWILTHR